MDMNKSFVLRKEDRAPKWHVIDASGLVLGRLCTRIAEMLRGKDRATYTAHTDSGDYVVVINCEKIVLTGNKWKGKIYDRYTGWRSGYRTETAEQVRAKNPARLVEHAVRGMLPKNILNRRILKKLKVYAGAQHPHQAQLNGFAAK